MPMLAANGLNVPAAFPAANYDSLHSHIHSGHASTPSYKKFVGGWSALSYRYAEATECVDEFEQSIVANGTAPAQPERYEQERILFDFFGSALSVFEAGAYAMFAAASLANSSGFPLATAQDERKVTPANLRKQLIAHFPNDPFTSAWGAVLDDPRYLSLHHVRNVLTHRIAVSRHHSLGGAQHGTSVWELTGAPITKDMLKPYASDLNDLLTAFLPAAEQFGLAHC